MSMNQRILARMQRLISDYQAGALSLGNLTRGLEGNLEAMEPRLPPEVEGEFVDYWGVLEEAYAVGEEGEYKPMISEALRNIEALLWQVRAENSSVSS